MHGDFIEAALPGDFCGQGAGLDELRSRSQYGDDLFAHVY
jgi:hypothetical protein